MDFFVNVNALENQTDKINTGKEQKKKSNLSIEWRGEKTLYDHTIDAGRFLLSHSNANELNWEKTYMCDGMLYDH